MDDTNPLTYLIVLAREDETWIELVGPTSTASLTVAPCDKLRLRVEHADGWSLIFVDGDERCRVTGTVVLHAFRSERPDFTLDFDGSIEGVAYSVVPAKGILAVPDSRALTDAPRSPAPEP